MAPSLLPHEAALCFGVERVWTPGKGIAEGRRPESRKHTELDSVGEQFEGLSSLGPTILKKPWKNWPGTRSQGAKGSYQLGGRIQVLLPPSSSSGSLKKSKNLMSCPLMS